MKSFAKHLSKLYGGKWKWDHRGVWHCDDGVRFVGRMASCTCDDACSHPPRLVMYGGGAAMDVLPLKLKGNDLFFESMQFIKQHNREKRNGMRQA